MTVLATQAVLFDMDGTLVDSTATVEKVWGAFAREADVDLAEVLAVVHGVPARATLRRFLGEAADIEPWFARIHAWETEWFDADVEIPGAVAFASSLPEGRCAVVTSAVREGAWRRLRRLGFPEFAALIAAEDVERGKPNPEPFTRGAEALGYTPGECVVFEDSAAGVRAGLAAGATVVVVGGVDTPDAAGLHRIPHFAAVRCTVSDTGLTLAWD